MKRTKTDLLFFKKQFSNKGIITWFVGVEITQVTAEQSGVLTYSQNSRFILQTPHFLIRECFVELAAKKLFFITKDNILNLHIEAIKKALLIRVSEIDMLQKYKAAASALSRDTDFTDSIIKIYNDDINSFNDELKALYKKVDFSAVAK